MCCQRKQINSGLSLNKDSVREPNQYFASLRRDNNNNNMKILENISVPHLFTLLSSSWHLIHVTSCLIGTKDVINYHDLKNHLSHPLTLIGYLIYMITVWNWSGKTLSPGALLAVLYFSSRHIFPPV